MSDPRYDIQTAGYFICDCCGYKILEKYAGFRKQKHDNIWGERDANTGMEVCDDCKPDYIQSLKDEGAPEPKWEEINDLDYD